MTRRELAQKLLEDESKLDEEVMIEDLEYSRYYSVDEVETKIMDILPNNEFALQSVKPHERFGHKNAIGEKIVTVLS